MSSLAVGTIIAYGGNLADPATLAALSDAGWRPCDGSAYNRAEYPDLYAAIGNANGGDRTSFNVPDLASRFLRGTAGGAVNIDPDAANRTIPAPGGASGRNTGSLQVTATAPPHTPWIVAAAGLHSHSCVHLNSDMHMAWSGSTYRMARWSGNAQTDQAGAHHHTFAGFDAATVPVNVALYFIIKVREPKMPTGTIPAGAITGFAGPLPAAPARWLKCDGTAYGVSRFPNLVDMILYNFGGDGVSVLNVPDLRGYFLRGTSHLTNRDPDAATRYELNTGGNTGDNVGSAQSCATATPMALVMASSSGHSHNIALIPQNEHVAPSAPSGPAANNCMVWTNAATVSSQDGEHGHTVMGGDKETRPENVYVDFLIASDNLPQSAPPIGTIMSFGGDISDPTVKTALTTAGWLPCDGSLLQMVSFQDLYDVIGTTFGSAPLKFAVPDLRGFFVVGAGTIALGAVQPSSTAGAPNNPILSSTDGAHVHTMYNVPTDTHVVDVIDGVRLAENNPNESPTSTDGAHTHSISGGDAESRPVNVNVDYIIRYK